MKDPVPFLRRVRWYNVGLAVAVLAFWGAVGLACAPRSNAQVFEPPLPEPAEAADQYRAVMRVCVAVNDTAECRTGISNQTFPLKEQCEGWLRDQATALAATFEARGIVYNIGGGCFTRAEIEAAQ